MKTVLIFGTFDGIHPGHEFFLREAKKHGDILVAVVSGDQHVHELKKRPPIYSQSERIKQLLASGLADRVVPADRKLGTYEVILRENPDVICLGHDQIHLKRNLEHWLRKKKLDIPLELTNPFNRDIYNSTALNKPVYTRKMILFYLLMITAMAMWGLSWVSAKIASREADPSLLVFWRIFTSFVAFVPIVVIRREKLFHGWRGLFWTGLAALCLTIYNQLFFRGLIHGLASRGGVIVTTLNPLFVFLLSLTLGTAQVKPRPLLITGLLLGLIGGLLFVEPWNLTTGELLKSGNLFFLGGALLWAGLTVSGHMALKTMPLFTYNMLINGFTVLLTLPFTGSRILTGSYTPLFWIQILYMGLLAGTFANAMYFMAARNIGASRAGAFTFMVPFSAVLSSWLILGESPGWITVIGGVICLTAIYLVNKAQRKESP